MVLNGFDPSKNGCFQQQVTSKADKMKKMADDFMQEPLGQRRVLFRSLVRLGHCGGAKGSMALNDYNVCWGNMSYYIILYCIILYYIILYIWYYIVLYYVILYYVMLYYIILYYIVLYCIILYYVILCYVILYYIILNYIILCYVILYYIKLDCIILYYVMLYYIILSYIILYYIILCYIILCYVILYYIILNYIILYYIIYIWYGNVVLNQDSMERRCGFGPLVILRWVTRPFLGDFHTLMWLFQETVQGGALVR